MYQIGLNLTKTPYIWVTGEEITYTNFAFEEPNVQSGDKFVVYGTYSNNT